MKIIDPGHMYEIASYDGGVPQVVTFMKRSGPGYPGNVGSCPGTNCQELFRVLIDRIKYLDRQIPCAENAESLECLRRALHLFESRAAKRHGIEMEMASTAIETMTTCPTCGHIVCHGH